MQAASPRRGYLVAISAYIVWGLSPLYIMMIASIPAIEFVAQRILWSGIFGSFAAHALETPRLVVWST